MIYSVYRYAKSSGSLLDHVLGVYFTNRDEAQQAVDRLNQHEIRSNLGRKWSFCRIHDPSEFERVLLKMVRYGLLASLKDDPEEQGETSEVSETQTEEQVNASM